MGWVTETVWVRVPVRLNPNRQADCRGVGRSRSMHLPLGNSNYRLGSGQSLTVGEGLILGSGWFAAVGIWLLIVSSLIEFYLVRRLTKSSKGLSLTKEVELYGRHL